MHNGNLRSMGEHEKGVNQLLKQASRGKRKLSEIFLQESNL